MANPPRKPDNLEKLALLTMLAHGQAQSDAYFETIGSAASLAASQVQDKRLEFLEKGPTVTASDVLLEIFLTASFRVLGGKLLEVVTVKALERILSTRRALTAALSRSELQDRLADKLTQSGLVDYVKEKVDPKDVAKGVEWGEVLARLQGPKDLYSDTPYLVTELASKVIYRVDIEASRRKTNYELLSPKDSPGVALADNASTFVIRQKTFNRTLFEELRIRVQLDLLSADDLLALLKELNVFGSEIYQGISLTKLKQKYKLFFEACIWAMSFPKGLQIAGRPPVLDLGGNRSRDFTEYLLSRILQPESGVPYRDLIQEIPAKLQLQGQSDNRMQVLQLMIRYFAELRKGILEWDARLPPEVQTRWEHPDS